MFRLDLLILLCQEGFSPDGAFDKTKYRAANPNLSEAYVGNCTWFHCIEYGIFEGITGCADIY